MSRAPKLVRPLPTERSEQIALFDWLRRVGVRTYPDLVWAFHVPNGEHRSPQTAQRLLRMGVQPGVPDVLLLLPRRGYHGLAVELKRATGHLSPAQRAWGAQLEGQGYCCRVCRSFEAARDTLVWYVSEEQPTQPEG